MLERILISKLKSILHQVNRLYKYKIIFVPYYNSDLVKFCIIFAYTKYVLIEWTVLTGNGH